MTWILIFAARRAGISDGIAEKVSAFFRNMSLGSAFCSQCGWVLFTQFRYHGRLEHFCQLGSDFWTLRACSWLPLSVASHKTEKSGLFVGSSFVVIMAVRLVGGRLIRFPSLPAEFEIHTGVTVHDSAFSS